MSEQLPLPPISESLWWAIPNRLAGARKPTAEDLTDLKELKIGALVSVLSDDANLELYNQRKIPYLWLPVEGGTAPRLDQLKQLAAFVNAQNALVGHL